MDSHDSVWASAHLLERLDSQFRSFLLSDPGHMFFDGLIFQRELLLDIPVPAPL
jgi:hypothetical protein